MSDFLDYYNKEAKKNAMTEEERFALHKKQKAMEAQRHKLDEEDDFYIGDDDIADLQEGIRRPSPRPRPIRKPIPQTPTAPRPIPRPIPQPAPAPAPAPVRKPVEDPFDKLERPIQTPAEAPRRRRIIAPETQSTNPALKEAYSMMDAINSKVEGMFYRYGMTGLEKISENIEVFFEAVINPPKEETKIIEQPAPVKRKVVKRTAPAKTNKSTATVTEKVATPVKEAKPEVIQKKFEDMNNNFDISLLGQSLNEQAKDSIRTEQINNTLKGIEANAKLIQESIEKKTSNNTQTEEDEIIQQEDLDIVDEEEVNPAFAAQAALEEAMNEPEIPEVPDINVDNVSA